MKPLNLLALIAFCFSVANAPQLSFASPKSQKLPSGLEIIDHKLGEGAKATAGNAVDVHYTGWLKNDDGSKGTEFDSSRKRNKPFSFTLGAGQVIQGWDKGVAGMQPGGKRTLVIPSALGYGARGAGKVIPPNADLIFDVELLKVK